MKIPYQFPEERNLFAVPAGKYRARLMSSTYLPNKKNNERDDIRFIFQIVADANGSADYRARKVYSSGINLYDLDQDLKAFFTDDEIAELKKTRKQIDLADLEGKTVDLLIITSRTVKEYKDPFSQIDGIFRAGTLLPNEKCEESTHHDHDDDDDALAA